jgi:hypothetical protein
MYNPAQITKLHSLGWSVNSSDALKHNSRRRFRLEGRRCINDGHSWVIKLCSISPNKLQNHDLLSGAQLSEDPVDVSSWDITSDPHGSTAEYSISAMAIGGEKLSYRYVVAEEVEKAINWSDVNDWLEVKEHPGTRDIEQWYDAKET